jgi:hypothetical protein
VESLVSTFQCHVEHQHIFQIVRLISSTSLSRKIDHQKSVLSTLYSGGREAPSTLPICKAFWIECTFMMNFLLTTLLWIQATRCRPGWCNHAFSFAMTVLQTVPTLLCSSSTHIFAQPGWDINYKETNPFIQELQTATNTCTGPSLLHQSTHPRSWWKVGFGNGTNDVKMLDRYSPTVHAPETCAILMVHTSCPFSMSNSTIGFCIWSVKIEWMPFPKWHVTDCHYCREPRRCVGQSLYLRLGKCKEFAKDQTQ